MGIHSEEKYFKVCICTCGDDHSVHDDSCSVGLNLDVFVMQQVDQDRK